MRTSPSTALDFLRPSAIARHWVPITLLVAALFAPRASPAQEHPARRLASIVGVAVEEYGKAVDEQGRLVSSMELQEASDFLLDAKQVAERLSGDRMATARLVLDSISLAIAAKRPPSEVFELHKRFAGALGEEGALEMPKRPLDIAGGKAIYDRSCASCHGASGMGDGAAARTMTPAPPALAADSIGGAASPGTMYRIVSVGVHGTPMAAFAGVLTPEQRWDVVAYVTSLRSHDRQTLQGEGLYLQRCASCHGTGTAPASYARVLTRLPPEIATLGWQAERSDEQIAAVIRNGIPGTAMPPSRDLTAEDTRAIVAYVRTLPLRNGNAVAQSSATGGVADAPRTVMALIDQALNAARDGRTSDAGDKAFDAYIAFEPLETTTRAKNPGLIAGMEQHFAEFKAAVRASDMQAATRARDAIELGLPSVVELTRPAASGWGAFLESFLIILREGFEAILVIGAVAAFLIKTGHRERLRSLWVGGALALLASAVTAVVLSTALSAVPASREIIEGGTMLVAVAVLFSVSYWLISKVEAAKWQQFIREKVTNALQHGGGKALALVAFLAVYREGAETALFYQALFREGGAVALPLGLGIIVGFAALTVIFTLFYRFGVKIPLRPFFTVTSALLYYMAFVFAGKGIKELQEGNAMSVTRLPGFPTVQAMGIYPTLETMLAQLLLVAAFIFALVKTFWPSRSVALPTMPPGTAPASGDLVARVTELSEQNARLQARLAALEDSIDERGRRRGAVLAPGDESR
ncbi:MAG TPA: cytochrome c/FTR1 family iron permease [Gemmatimonadaceae bacterium]|nr:cytochrome c/FTR1 family iron permease [Gemmatimonadaceae bacterium]